MSLNLTYAIGAGHNRTHVRQDFDDIEAWAATVPDGAGGVGSTELDVLPACRVGKNANQSIPNDTATQLTFQTEAYDTDNIHSTVSNTGRLTVATPGIYSVFASVAFFANATGYRYVEIQYNGTTAVAECLTSPVTSYSTAITLSSEYLMAAGDYFDVSVIQTSGGALSVSSITAAFGCCFRTRAS